MTSVTPLITRCGRNELAGWVGALSLPHHSLCVPRKAVPSISKQTRTVFSELRRLLFG